MCANLDEGNDSLRQLHGERNHVSLRRGERKTTKEGKFLPYGAEDRAARTVATITLMATSAAPWKKNEPKVQSADIYAKMAISSAKSHVEGKPLVI